MIRTDLAIEGIDLSEVGGEGNLGITHREWSGEVTKSIEVEIKDEAAGAKIGKGVGKYLTIEIDGISRVPIDFGKLAEEVSDGVRSFLGGGRVTVLGLGNRGITPDALGPKVVDGILSTRHLLGEEIFKDLREVISLAPGVMAQTGLEATEIAKGVVTGGTVIVVDALACSDMSRLGNTIQITDTGISPGSGVANHRKELSRRTLGVDVIGIGIPTVIDMHTIVENITGSRVKEGIPNMMVTPRDIDQLVHRGAKLLSMAINIALQETLSQDEIEFFVS